MGSGERGTSRTEHALMRIKLCLNLVHVVLTEGYRLTSGRAAPSMAPTQFQMIKNTLYEHFQEEERPVVGSDKSPVRGEKFRLEERRFHLQLSFFSRTCSQDRTQGSLLGINGSAGQGLKISKNRIYYHRIDHNLTIILIWGERGTSIPQGC